MTDDVLLVETSQQDLILESVGTRGPAGSSGGVTQYDVTIPAATWTIVHGFSHHVMVSVFISDTEVITDIEQPDTDTVVITFASPQTGYVLIV